MVKLQGCMVNALVPEVDERRDKLRELRVGANILWSADFWMGEPLQVRACKSSQEGWVYGLGDRVIEDNVGKWNISVPTGKEIKEIPWVVASEMGIA